jgi:hypothetical protein
MNLSESFHRFGVWFLGTTSPLKIKPYATLWAFASFLARDNPLAKAPGICNLSCSFLVQVAMVLQEHIMDEQDSDLASLHGYYATYYY